MRAEYASEGRFKASGSRGVQPAQRIQVRRVSEPEPEQVTTIDDCKRINMTPDEYLPRKKERLLAKD